MAKTTYYPQSIGVRVPEGWPERVRAAAEAAESDAGQWLRETIKRGLESAERAERRRKAAK